MEITHKTYNLRIAPRKLRLVVNKMRYMPAQRALEVLPLIVNKGGYLAFKSLQSAVQVAKDRDLDPNTLVIQGVWADEGMKLKRIIGHSRGRMAPIRKHYSHLSIVLRGEALGVAKTRTKAKAEKVAETPADQAQVQEN